MKSVSPIFESWETLFAECFAIGGKYHPHSRWSSPTRFIAYEPGRDGFLGTGERQQGRFTFEAQALADLIEREYGDQLSRCPENHALWRWLQRADIHDERITRLPDDIGLMQDWIESLLEADACEVFCRACGRTIAHKLIREVPIHRMQRVRILCPSIHLLLSGEGRKYHGSSRQSFEGLEPILPPRIPSRLFLDPPPDLFERMIESIGQPGVPEPRPKMSGKLRNRYGPDMHVCYDRTRVEFASRPIVRIENSGRRKHSESRTMKIRWD